MTDNEKLAAAITIIADLLRIPKIKALQLIEKKVREYRND